MHSGLSEIGFVLHKTWSICRGLSTSVEEQQQTPDNRRQTTDARGQGSGGAICDWSFSSDYLPFASSYLPFGTCYCPYTMLFKAISLIYIIQDGKLGVK